MDEDEADATEEAARARRVLDWGKTTAQATQAKAKGHLDAHRHRAPVELAIRIYERDRDAAGSLLGSAVAFRLFLFFVPMLLALVGLAGFVSNIGEPDPEDAGITGNMAQQINTALTQPNSTRWIATILGLFGMLSAGRTLSKVLNAASCMAWAMPVRSKASVRAIGATIGLVVGIALVATIVSRIRHSLGVGVASISFVAAMAVYTVAWLLLFLMLPRKTADPGSVLPGAVLMGATLAGMQAVSQLYLPGRFSKASELYGAVGVTIVTLGWFFIMGRATVLSLTLNAVTFERFGSISDVVFGLPVLHRIPRRWPKIARFFELDVDPATSTSGPGPAAAGETVPDATDERPLG